MRQYQADPAPIDLEVRKENRKVANWLLFYEERKKEYQELREEILGASSQNLSGASIPKNAVSDPTGKKAVKLAQLQKMEQWIELVEEVERRLPPKMRLFLKLRREYRYSKGNRGWVAPVQYRYVHEVAEMLGKKPEDVWIENRRTFWVWWSRIIEYTARLAAKRGLLREEVKE